MCRFWRQNIMKFEEKDFEVQKALVKLLKESLYAFPLPKGFFVDPSSSFSLRRSGRHISQRRAFAFRDDRGTADRETKIAVACHDLGEIARLHPRGGKIMSLTPEAKTCVFSAMELPDADCKRETLLCMQKMMVAAVAQ